jgi:hypothetical protein
MGLETTYQSFELPGKAYYKTAGIEMPDVIEMRHMTVKEIKHFSNLSEHGDMDLFADGVIQSCVKTKFDYTQLVPGDRIYLFYMLRALTMDNIYAFDVPCSRCGKVLAAGVNIFDLPKKEYDVEKHGYPLSVVLPKSKKTVEFILPNRSIEKTVQQEIRIYKEEFPNADPPEAIYLLKKIIKSISGIDTTADLVLFIDSMHFMDWRTLDKAISAASPGLDTDLIVPCTNEECGHKNNVTMSIRVNEFFLL